MCHKLGNCPSGEVSILISVSSIHRKESLESVNFAIYEFKKLVPIWKKVCASTNDLGHSDNCDNLAT